MNDGGTRTLVLPDGGTMEIPLPGSRARFVMKPGKMFGESPACPARLTLFVGITLGLLVGAGAAVWYLRSR